MKSLVEYELDEYRMALPTQQTAEAVAMDLHQGMSTLLALGLGEGTMMNCLFAMPRVGSPANAYRLNQLIVAIDRRSMYQFYPDLRNGTLHEGYVAEKLMLPLEDAKVMRDFIEMIREELSKYGK